MTDANDVPICTCFDDWHANNAENHEPTCPVIAAFATLTRERDALKTQLASARLSIQAMELSRDKRLERARSTIAFFASVIKSGEPWTTSCEEARTAALSEATP
jgi:hypothetical protein